MAQGNFLQVGDGHELYFEQYGNPDGVNIIFLHGGPGLGFSDSDKRFFDPDIFNVLLFDQRGGPRSVTDDPLFKNEPSFLVNDLYMLMIHVGMDTAYLFGGSWGSTLAMLFALEYPNMLDGIILRGYFPANRKCVDFMFDGSVKEFFPLVWERFSSFVPEKHQNEISKYYLEKMLSEDPDIRDRFIYEWTLYGLSLARRGVDPKKAIKNLGPVANPYHAILTAYYAVNYCFLEEDYILKNCHKVADKPISIVHGRYDFICPPKYAIELHQKLPGSQLYMVDAAHASDEPEIEKKLMVELGKIKS